MVCHQLNGTADCRRQHCLCVEQTAAVMSSGSGLHLSHCFMQIAPILQDAQSPMLHGAAGHSRFCVSQATFALVMPGGHTAARHYRNELCVDNSRVNPWSFHCMLWCCAVLSMLVHGCQHAFSDACADTCTFLYRSRPFLNSTCCSTVSPCLGTRFSPKVWSTRSKDRMCSHVP